MTPSSENDLVLLHNPRCSKSRALKAVLDERGSDYTLRLYLEQPLDRDELAALHTKLDLPAARLVRSKEPEFEVQGLSPESDDAELLDAIARVPKLMERPILIRGERAAIGRPGPDEALGLLS